MQLLITKVVSVENHLTCFSPVWKQVTDSELLRGFEDPSSCDLSLPQLSFWHRQLLEGPMPTLGQMWSLSEGGGYRKGSVGAARWCDVDSGTLGTSVLNKTGDCPLCCCLGSSAHGCLMWWKGYASGICPSAQWCRERGKVFSKLFLCRKLIIKATQRPNMGGNSVFSEGVRTVSIPQNWTAKEEMDALSTTGSWGSRPLRVGTSQPVWGGGKEEGSGAMPQLKGVKM